MNPYMQTVAHNLSHLRVTVPQQPKRNLASNSATMPMTEDDVYLSRRIKWGQIPEGRMGTRRTMETMAQLARESARDPLFQKFVKQFTGLHDLERWTRDHFVYRDEHEELIRTPLFMLQDMGRSSGNRIIGLEGDCDDVATFLTAAAKVLGRPARLVAIRANRGNPDFEH